MTHPTRLSDLSSPPAAARFALRSPRAGGARPLLVALVVAAACLVVWMGRTLFLDSPQGAAAAGAGDQDRSTAAMPQDQGAALLQPSADGPSAAQAPAEVRSQSKSRNSQRTQLEESEIVWVEGRVILPEGTPLDEKVFVESREKGGLGEPRDRDEIDALGKFRVAFSKDTSIGWLRLRGRYVWYAGSLSVRPNKMTEEELLLEPILGGRIEGSLVVSGGGRLPVEEIEVRVEGTTDSKDHRRRTGKVKFDISRDEGGQSARFLGNAIPPGLYRLECTPEGFLSKVVEEFRVSAGEVATLELELVPTPTFSGRVLDPEGEPVAEAELWMNGHVGSDEELALERRKTTSDAEGRFALRGVFPGEVSLRISADGFEGYNEDFDLSDSPDGQVHDISLSFGGTLSGRVIYADGKPAAGARVTAKGSAPSNFRSSFSEDASETTDTDEEGRFFISALGDGPFELLCSTPQPEGDGYFVGQKKDILVDSSDVILTLGPGYTLTGRVFDLTGKPIKRYALSVRPEGIFSFLRDPGSVGVISQRVRDSDGKFKVEGLLPGSWDVNIVAGGYAVTEQIHLQLPPQPAELRIEMFRLATLKGLILGPDGQPVAKANVRYQKESGGFDLGSFGSKKTNRRGQFRFGGVSPGTIRISATADGYAAAETLVLEVTREMSREDLVLRLGLGATIEGVVQNVDGNPAEDVEVSWNNSERNESDRVAVDKEGHFRATGVPAGPVTVTATISFTNPNGHGSGTRSVSAERILAEGDVWTPILRDEAQTLRATSIEVKRNGEAWGGVRVELTQQGEGPDWNVRGNTDEAGLATLDLPGQGRYSFSLRQDSDRISGSCDLDSSGELKFDLSLGTVEGHVTTQPGKTPLYVSVLLQPSDPDSGTFRLSSQSIDVDEDGNFSGESILAGTYTITASGPTLDGKMIQSVEQEIKVRGAGRTTSIELVMDQESEFNDRGGIFGGF